MEQSSTAEGRSRVKLITRIKTGYAAAQTTQTSPLVFVWGGNIKFPVVSEWSCKLSSHQNALENEMGTFP